jgi:hypothetical protein
MLLHLTSLACQRDDRHLYMQIFKWPILSLSGCTHVHRHKRMCIHQDRQGVEAVAVHVRRTDYALYPGKHDFLPKTYYEQVLLLALVAHSYMYTKVCLPFETYTGKGRHDFDKEIATSMCDPFVEDLVLDCSSVRVCGIWTQTTPLLMYVYAHACVHALDAFI